MNINDVSSRLVDHGANTHGSEDVLNDRLYRAEILASMPWVLEVYGSDVRKQYMPVEEFVWKHCRDKKISKRRVRQQSSSSSRSSSSQCSENILDSCISSDEESTDSSYDRSR